MTFEVCTLRFLFFLLQSFCLKGYNQKNKNNNNNSDKNSHKLFVVLNCQQAAFQLYLFHFPFCTEIKQEKLKNAESWKVKVVQVHCSDEDVEHSMSSTQAL